MQIGRSDGLDTTASPLHLVNTTWTTASSTRCTWLNTATWTADGKSVDYSVNFQDSHSVYESRPNGSGEHLLFAEPHGHINRLSVAPNGDIAYSFQPAIPVPGVAVGPDIVKVWHRATGTTTVISTSATSPDISPDGTKLVYLSSWPRRPATPS